MNTLQLKTGNNDRKRYDRHLESMTVHRKYDSVIAVYLLEE